MPLFNLPGELNRKKFIKALIRLGFVINRIGGKGSHYKVIWSANNKSITIPADLRKDVLRYIIKEVENISGVTWDEINDKL